jgi:DNA-binding IclR family transcriptional regulator
VTLVTISFYPPHLRTLFTDRERELALLEQATLSLAEGRPRHLALFGLRRIGKTLLLLEHMAHLIEQEPGGPVRPAYIDMEELVTSPELFSRRYVGLVAFWALTAGQGERESFLTPAGLLSGPSGGLRCVAQTLGAIEQAQTDPALQVSTALDFPEKLAEELDCRILLLLDEFTELAVLGNYPAVRRPMHLFRSAMQRQGRLGYVVAASAVSAMQHLVQDGQSPLFLQFEALEVARFSLDASQVLVERVLGATPSPGVGRRIHELTGGHPFYIYATTLRLVGLAQALQAITPQDAERAFILEALSRNGQIYNYCRYLYDISLSRARGYGILKAILQTLAKEEGLALSDLARRIRKTAPTARSYLRALQEVDLVVEQGGGYFYRDPVLRYWVAAMTRGVEADPTASHAVLAPLLADLEAQQVRLSTELGRARESQVRELLRRFAGQEVDGAWLGTGGRLPLPAFSQVQPYRSADGQVEVDALAETADGQRWAVEVKWQNKAVGEKELVALARKAELMQAQPWCISRSGFTIAAQQYAEEKGIMLSSRSDLEKLEKSLNAWPQG